VKKNIILSNCSGIIGKIRCLLRPVENCNVSTFANNKNSNVVKIKDVLPGDIITMIGKSETKPMGNKNYDHILIIEKVDYENEKPKTIHYIHAISYPEDGLYGSGIKKGQIGIVNENGSIAENNWIENGRTDASNPLFSRAKISQTEIRRMNFL